MYTVFQLSLLFHLILQHKQLCYTLEPNGAETVDFWEASGIITIKKGIFPW